MMIIMKKKELRIVINNKSKRFFTALILAKTYAYYCDLDSEMDKKKANC